MLATRATVSMGKGIFRLQMFRGRASYVRRGFDVSADKTMIMWGRAEPVGLLT